MKFVVFLLTFAVALDAVAHADASDTLATAKELYATAGYQEALTLLTDARKAARESSPEAVQLDQYRVFCLFALGRRAEANSIAETIVRTDPFFEPSHDDASPAIIALFAAVKKHSIPAVIKDRYRAGKAALDRGDEGAAEPLLQDVQRLIAQWRAGGENDDAVSDIEVLADGFLSLARSKAALAAPRTPPPAPLVAEPAAPIVVADTKPAAGRGPVFGPDSPGVTPPVAIDEMLPPVPAQFARVGEKRGIYEVTIDPRGHVEAVAVRQSISAGYDRIAVDAAKKWRFKPATKDGQPVTYIKAVAVQVK